VAIACIFHHCPTARWFVRRASSTPRQRIPHPERLAAAIALPEHFDGDRFDRVSRTHALSAHRRGSIVVVMVRGPAGAVLIVFVSSWRPVQRVKYVLWPALIVVRDIGIEPVIASRPLRCYRIGCRAMQHELIDWPLMNHSGLPPLPSPPLCAGVLRTEVASMAVMLTAPEAGRLAPLVQVDCYFPGLSKRLASGCQWLCSTAHFVWR
jgi:hypothetical protein